MAENPIDQQLDRIAASTPEIDQDLFESSVWNRIHQQPQRWRGITEGLQSFGPGAAWRAAPAAMALVVGSVSGAALAADRDVDDLAVFTSHAPFSISVLADLPKAGS
jgi:hypothetical protein